MAASLVPSGQLDGVAVDAAVARQHGSAQVELRCSGQRILVALAAAGLNVARRQDRFFAGSFAVVRLCNRGGSALPAMADDASESVQRMRNYRVFAERLLVSRRQDWLHSIPGGRSCSGPRRPDPAAKSDECQAGNDDAGSTASPRSWIKDR